LDLLLELQAKNEVEMEIESKRQLELDGVSGGVLLGSGTDRDSDWGSPSLRSKIPVPLFEECSTAERLKRGMSARECSSTSSCTGSAGVCVSVNATTPTGKGQTVGMKSKGGEKAPVDDTPRKMRRMLALKNARYNQTGEGKQTLCNIAFIASWNSTILAVTAHSSRNTRHYTLLSLLFSFLLSSLYNTLLSPLSPLFLSLYIHYSLLSFPLFSH
jgi:u-PAR/Ly-6 domain